jgi:hypothetical protein
LLERPSYPQAVWHHCCYCCYHYYSYYYNRALESHFELKAELNAT